MPRRPQRRLPLTSRMKDGRIYKQNGKSRRGIIYLICQKHSCFGTAKIVNNEIQLINAHSQHCHSDPQAENIARFKDAIKAALRTHWYKLRELYGSLAIVYPEAAEHVSYHSLRSTMKRWRKSFYPPSPRRIQDFVERLADPEFERNLEYGDDGRLSVQLVTDAGGNHHAVMYDANFVATEMRDVTKIFIDGTFRSTPSIEDASQLVTIMGVKFNHGFPFIWIVMSRKTESAYVAVQRHVKATIMQYNQIRLAMTDFERGLRNAIRLVWDEAHVTGCNTHYDRAVIQKAKTLGLRNVLREYDGGALFLKKILALAYLPANLIERQFQILRDSLPNNLRRRLTQFCSYYTRYWLRTVRPEGFSVYGLGRRTNNVIESYHSRLGHRMERSPAPWDFVDKLLKLAADVRGDVRRLRRNCQISRHARYSTIFKQNRLTKAWKELHLHQITAEEFLQKAASLKGDVTQLIAEELNSRQGPEYDLQAPPVAIRLDEDPDYEPELFADEAPHWLIDNAEVAPEAPADDGPNNENNRDDTSDSSSSSDTEIPHEIEEVDDVQPVDHGDVEVRPRGIHVDDDIHGEDEIPADDEIHVNADNHDDGNHAEAGNHAGDDIHELDFVEVRPVPHETPPPQVIDVLVPHHPLGGVLHEVDLNRQQGQRNRNGSAVEQPMALAELPRAEPPALNKRQRRNRRRNEMKRRARARAANENAQPQHQTNELAQVVEELRQQTEIARAARIEVERLRGLAEDQALCRVCFATNATHAFQPCGHRHACGQCATRIWHEQVARAAVEDNYSPQCPFCRGIILQAPQRIWLV